MSCEHQHDSLKRGTCIKQNRHIGFQDTDSIPLGNIAGFFLLLLFLAYRGNDFIKSRTNIAMEIKEGTKNKERTHEYRKRDGMGGMKERMKKGRKGRTMEKKKEDLGFI